MFHDIMVSSSNGASQNLLKFHPSKSFKYPKQNLKAAVLIKLAMDMEHIYSHIQKSIKLLESLKESSKVKHALWLLNTGNASS